MTKVIIRLLMRTTVEPYILNEILGRHACAIALAPK